MAAQVVLGQKPHVVPRWARRGRHGVLWNGMSTERSRHGGDAQAESLSARQCRNLHGQDLLERGHEPDTEGQDFEFKEILKPIEEYRDQILVIRGLCNKLRGDGDSHMRGMGCLLTGIELAPGNIQGGSDTPNVKVSCGAGRKTGSHSHVDATIPIPGTRRF